MSQVLCDQTCSPIIFDANRVECEVASGCTYLHIIIRAGDNCAVVTQCVICRVKIKRCSWTVSIGEETKSHVHAVVPVDMPKHASFIFERSVLGVLDVPHETFELRE